MYSKRILEELKKKGIAIGDIIKITSRTGTELEGTLMPRPEIGDPEIIVLKLASGYNTGMHADSIDLVRKNSKPAAATHVAAAGVAGRELHKTHGSTNFAKNTMKSKIAILGAGGTIASKIDYRTGGVSPSITAEELRNAIPALESWNVHSKIIFSLLSEDMNARHWKLIAEAIEKEIKDGSEGVVVMHGTDTMSYTAAAMSFMLQHLPVPVVLVGSQRSSDRPSSENEMNMLNSVFAANQDLGEVTVCMHANTNDDFCYLHRGTRVRKMHTSRRDAFHTINSLPLFAVDYRTKRFEPLSAVHGYKKRNKGTAEGSGSGSGNGGLGRAGGFHCNKNINDNVALVYSHPNIKPSLISGLDKYDGVVLVGTGLGHVPTGAFGGDKERDLLEPIKELIASGIPVVMSPQCISGRLCLRVYSTGRILMDAGVIGDGADWTPEAAYVKLCWVLGQTKDTKKVAELMMTDIAGEITPRSQLEEQQWTEQ